MRVQGQRGSWSATGRMARTAVRFGAHVDMRGGRCRLPPLCHLGSGSPPPPTPCCHKCPAGEFFEESAGSGQRPNPDSQAGPPLSHLGQQSTTAAAADEPLRSVPKITALAYVSLKYVDQFCVRGRAGVSRGSLLRVGEGAQRRGPFPVGGGASRESLPEEGRRTEAGRCALVDGPRRANPLGGGARAKNRCRGRGGTLRWGPSAHVQARPAL